MLPQMPELSEGKQGKCERIQENLLKRQEIFCSFLLICGIIAIACIIMPALGALLSHSHAAGGAAQQHKTAPSAALLLLETLPLHLSLICATLMPAIVFKRQGEQLLESLNLIRPSLPMAAMLIGAEFILFPLLAIVTLASSAILSLIHGGLASSQMIVQQALACSSSGFAVIVFGAAFLAPVAEELAFRRTAFRFLNGFMGTIPAMIATSALFAATHCSLTQFPALFLLGMALQWAFVKWKSLTPCIMLHCLHNSVSLMILLVARQLPALKTLDF